MYAFISADGIDITLNFSYRRRICRQLIVRTASASAKLAHHDIYDDAKIKLLLREVCIAPKRTLFHTQTRTLTPYSNPKLLRFIRLTSRVCDML